MTLSVQERILDRVLAHAIRCGSLTLIAPDGSERRYEGTSAGPGATVRIRSTAAISRLAMGGSIGLAESYIRGEWDTPDLDAVLDLGVANIGDSSTRPTPLTPFVRFWHSLRDNSISGSRRNIAAHYDLGNDFYRLWLDPTMTYSSAMFDGSDDDSLTAASESDLTDAQVRKWDALLEKLDPGPKDRVLEIGCGWGGFAIHAAKTTGCRVLGLTLSEEQLAWATGAVEHEGLDGRVELRLQDYRHVSEEFTRIASIEMFEAVGEKWWPTYFRRVRELLGRSGIAALQTITIEEPRFDDYRAHPDFIQRYIFPGGMLPSPERFLLNAGREGLAVGEPQFFGMSYARTLCSWRASFEAALPRVRELGFDERFIRMWRYYLAYCRAGFEAGSVNVMQVDLSA